MVLSLKGGDGAVQARESERKAVGRKKNNPETELIALPFPLSFLLSEKKHERVHTTKGEKSYLKMQFKKTCH